LGIYLGLMFVHAFTGLSAFGYISSNFLQQLGQIPAHIFAIAI
jgi:hypothetical protein